MARGLHAGFLLGDFRITPARCELAGPDGIRSVHPRAMEVLLYLAEHAGALVARDTLREKVWGGAAVTEETLTRSIGELRHELGDSPDRPRYIQTVPRRGYRLIAPVTALEDAPRSPSASPAQRFLGELKRRKVFRVTAAYAVVAWLLLQIADVTLDALPVPEGSMTLLVILAAMGFPIAVVLAWALEITDQGVELDPVTASRWPRLAGLWRYLLGGMALAGIAGVTAYLVTRPPPIVDSRYPIAVLPFDDLTPAADNAFCDGLTEELTNYLAKIRELRVASRTSTTALKMLGLPIPDIAERLKVDYVLEGSCRSEEGALRVTAQLIKAAEDSTKRLLPSFLMMALSKTLVDFSVC